MKNIINFIWILLLMLVCIIIHDVLSVVIDDKTRSEQDTNNVSVINLDLTEAEATSENAENNLYERSEDSIDETDSTEEEVVVDYAEAMPSRVLLDMENILQLPELPTGCESVALTMLLTYYGFDDLEKTTIADEYLIYGDSFVVSYMGDPYSSYGAGCYTPGLVKTANKFLSERDSMLNAKNIEGSTPQTLYKHVANGTPVVVWNTAYFIDNNPKGVFEVYNNKSYEWDSSEHCVVFIGYDFNRQVVIINDPLEGIVERDANRFWSLYENLGSMALIIQ